LLVEEGSAAEKYIPVWGYVMGNGEQAAGRSGAYNVIACGVACVVSCTEKHNGIITPKNIVTRVQTTVIHREVWAVDGIIIRNVQACVDNMVSIDKRLIRRP
jgi:hypothetical protein